MTSLQLEGKYGIFSHIPAFENVNIIFSFIHPKKETLFIFIQRPVSFSFLKKINTSDKRHDEMPSSVSKQLMQGYWIQAIFGGFHIKLWTQRDFKILKYSIDLQQLEYLLMQQKFLFAN